ncbi:hypothetical protein GJ496_006106 [Pomphorhynchus laevis]|nr:hypothetical protein GJ496_006106 [Pomphorhynchus laevis]
MKNVIYLFIHQIFLESSNACRNIHLQGYNYKLVSHLVENVPSMHVCIEILPQMLSNGDIENQVLSMHLLKELAMFYPVAQCIMVCKLAFCVIRRLALEVDEESKAIVGIRDGKLLHKNFRRQTLILRIKIN